MGAGDRSVLQVAIPIFNGITALDAIGPYESLHVLRNVQVVFVAHKPGTYQASLGYLSFNVTTSFHDVPRPDIIIIPGGFGNRVLVNDHHFLEWLVKAHETSLYTASVSTGSLVLAAAGLLKGLQATTHWSEIDSLASFGAKPVNSQIVQEGKILTAAGSSAGIELGLKLASLITDDLTAKALQLRLEYTPCLREDKSQAAAAAANISSLKSSPRIVEIAHELEYRVHADAVGRAMKSDDEHCW